MRGAPARAIHDYESSYYNQVIDRGTVEADWNSHEEMRREDELYRVGLVVAHNQAAVPRDGSCIFLHIWRGPHSTTVGCTVMPAEAVEEIAEWTDAAERPVFVQLPQGEYERLRSSWRLP